jgi:eukaryotic-like serine/threonine-protein kinase
MVVTVAKINLQVDGLLEEAIDSLRRSHYQIRSRLGEGGFGEVYEAWDTKLCRSVAIKRLKNALNTQRSESLIKEARLAASLQHTAFVKIHSIEEYENSQSIVMELVPGITLKQWIQTQPQDQLKALEVVRQIAEAMQEAHASGLIHGDLKPSNLIIEPSGKVRILDFGLAIKGDIQATTSLLQLDPQGTIAYMAPERLLGAQPSLQSDIYALGAILFELLAGARPFASLTGLALAAAHMQSTSDSWNYPESISPPIIKLIRGMTARQPEQRLVSMQEVCTQIAALSTLNLAVNHISNKNFARWPMLAKKQRVVLAAALASVLLLTAAWHIAPYLNLLPTEVAPYSQALEFNKGLAALTLFDRPGSLDAADKSFTTILEHSPNNAAAVAGLALVYSLRYRSDSEDSIWLQKADASAQRAIQLNNHLALVHVAHGGVLSFKGKHEAAIETLARALALEPTNIFAWRWKMTSLRSAKRYEEAIELAERGLQQFPKDRFFADELGMVYIDQGNFVLAEQAFRRSISLQPDAVYAYANLSAALVLQNRNDEALQTLQQGLQIRPSALLYGNLGNALFNRADYVGAAAAFEAAVSPTKGSPGKYLAWANLADTLRWIPGRTKEAQKAYDKARELLAPQLERNADDVTLISRMALYAARVDNRAQAQTLMQRALVLEPKNANVQFRAGLAYELLGDHSAALAALTQAIALGFPIKLIEAEPDLLNLRRESGAF